MPRITLLQKADETIQVTTDGRGTFVETTSAGNRQFGSDRHDEVVDDYKRQGWMTISDDRNES